MEFVSNDAVGLLNAAITSGDTSLTLQTGQGALFPSNGNFRVRIDSEIIIVGARSGDTLSSLTRAAENTIAAGHSVSAVVRQTITAAGLAAFVSGEFDYVERTTNLTVSATTSASGVDWIVGNAVTYDGSTRIKIEAYTPRVDTGTTFGSAVIITLWDGSTQLSDIGVWFAGGNTGTLECPATLTRYLTPSVGSHTYKLKAYRQGSDGVIEAGNGTTVDTGMPAYMRITRA